MAKKYKDIKQTIAQHQEHKPYRVIDLYQSRMLLRRERLKRILRRQRLCVGSV